MTWFAKYPNINNFTYQTDDNNTINFMKKLEIYNSQNETILFIYLKVLHAMIVKNHLQITVPST